MKSNIVFNARKWTSNTNTFRWLKIVGLTIFFLRGISNNLKEYFPYLIISDIPTLFT